MLPFQEQPKIFASIRAGYQTVSKHLYLILFPIALDLFLLFGVRITFSALLQGIFERFTVPASSSAEVIAAWDAYKAQLMEFSRFFSLTTFLRSFPVGIPSLFSGVAFKNNPLGSLTFIDLQQQGSVLLVMAGFSILGLFLAYILYRLVANAALAQPEQKSPIVDMRSLIAWMLIPLASTAIVLILILPAIFLISLIGTIFPAFTTIGYFLLTLGLVTLITPLVFTPHLVMLENLTFPQALLTSIRAVRLTNAKSSTFIIGAILVNYLANMLWRIPQETSWMLLVGVLGHALISIITITASYHYIAQARASISEFDKNHMSEEILA